MEWLSSNWPWVITMLALYGISRDIARLREEVLGLRRDLDEHLGITERQEAQASDHFGDAEPTAHPTSS